MAATKDFRAYSIFDVVRVDAAGKSVSKDVYWKLYAIEYTVRVLVHSVLTQQIGINWWNIAVDPKIQAGVKSRQADYASQPWHSTPVNTMSTMYSYLT